MGDIISKLNRIAKYKLQGYWADRIVSEIEYANKVSKVNNGRFDETISLTADFLLTKFDQDGSLTKGTALKAEYMLDEISKEAKQYRIICAAHAHIDMNWMWRFDETVSVALDTFRTMLDLMNEYPEFKFSQSQASVYKIVEEYAPEMLEEIKARVKEGRWEVTASTWVEPDKNMPNGESLARHILYTKKYLSKLLDIEPESLNIDFEPDTFGHSMNVPEILSEGGVKYYYHCRGYNDHTIYKWAAPSGKYIIVYREPLWYNSDINSSIGIYAPEFCSKHKMNTMLKVYGVGDHGGGPTRRDIEKVIDMNNWPVFPKIDFGTFKEYFANISGHLDNLPEVSGELNFLFTGCYTTQSRIKQANRISEASLNEAEAFCAISDINSFSKYPHKLFENSWQDLLFNQFHDILPGSGTVDTREYAMGLFQKTMAVANTKRTQAVRSIASKINTSTLIGNYEDNMDNISQGAGVGFGIKDFKIAAYEIGKGSSRIFHIFNPCLFNRSEVVEITVWDFKYDINRMVFKDINGGIVEHQVIDNGFNNYWGHSYLRVLIKADIPACGYNTYVLMEDEEIENPVSFPKDPRVEVLNEYKLENELIKVSLNPNDASIISIIDKSSGDELIKKGCKSGIFRYIEEDDSRGMTAWTVGRYMNSTDLLKNVKIKACTNTSASIRQSIDYEIQFNSSTIKVNVSLDKESRAINYNVECDWREIGKPGKFVPQLGFYLPLGFECGSYKYDIPCGTVDRKGMDMDVPANSFISGINSNAAKKSVMLITDSKYGFRGFNNSIAVTLIRSSYDPDPYPEFGVHQFNFTVCLTDNSTNKEMIVQSLKYNHPLSIISGNAHNGELNSSNSFAELKQGNVIVSAVKCPEEEDGSRKMIVRVYESEGINGKVVLKFSKKPCKAYFVDINEKCVDCDINVEISKNEVCFDVLPFSIHSILIEF